MPLLAVALFALVALMGIAVDAGRAMLVWSKLNYAIDAAGLAAGARLNSTSLQAEVAKFVNANFAAGYTGARVTDVHPTVSPDGTLITIAGTAVMPTTFMRIVGIQDVTVNARSEITRAVNGLELVMVLDNTGSMAPYMANLKTAAKDLVNILFGDSASIDNLFIGLVPFSQAVNIGTGRTSWIDGVHKDSLDWGPSSQGGWHGCVEARRDGLDVTDAPPSEQLFRAYYAPDTSSNDWIRSGSYRTPFSTSSRGPNLYCPARMTGMTRQRSAVVAAIEAMQAVGGTHVNVGAVWGWRMLSPRWRGSWGGDMNLHNLPLDYNTEKMEKAAVIMTDGANTAYTDVYSAYGFLNEGRLGTTSSTSAAAAELDRRLAATCTAMKNAGIIVYTIAFANPGATIESMMRGCATQPDFYFRSPTTADLQTAFRTIADALSNLRVSR